MYEKDLREEQQTFDYWQNLRSFSDDLSFMFGDLCTVATEVRFCTECKWAKEIIMNDGIVIKCMKRNPPENLRQKVWACTFSVFRKLNSTACADFVTKDD